MIEANVNTDLDDDTLASIQAEAIEHRKDFDSSYEAYDYFYNSAIRGCYQQFESNVF